MIARYLVGFFLLVLVSLAGVMGYAGHKAEQSFDTDIKAITAKYPMVHINNYQYHKGFLTSTNDFEIVLGCDNGTDKDKQIHLKIQNKINHIPVSSHGLRSAQVETTVLPNDDFTRQIAEKAHLPTLATAITDVDFDGGYHSTVKVPSGNAQDQSSGKGSINWDEITYKIDKQSKETPNYTTDLRVPKITVAANDSTANVKVELLNFTSHSDSEQTATQTLPTKSTSKNHIDKLTFDFNSSEGKTNKVNLSLNNYEETSAITSHNDLVDLTSHSKVAGNLNSFRLDSIELDTTLTNIHHATADKLAEQFTKTFSQCEPDNKGTEALLTTLKNSLGELAKHQPKYSFKFSVTESGNKGSLEMAQELQSLLIALQDTNNAKSNPKTLMDGNRISVDLPKVWLENLQNWLNDNKNSKAEKSAEFEKSLLADNYIKLENGHYLTNIEMKQGEIFVNRKKLEDKPKPTSTAEFSSSDTAQTPASMGEMANTDPSLAETDISELEKPLGTKSPSQ